MSQAAIQLLTRRWGLPDAATPVLGRFFSAWAAGHTSLELSDEEAELLASSPAVTTGTDANGRGPARPTRHAATVLAPGSGRDPSGHQAASASP